MATYGRQRHQFDGSLASREMVAAAAADSSRPIPRTPERLLQTPGWAQPPAYEADRERAGGRRGRYEVALTPVAGAGADRSMLRPGPGSGSSCAPREAGVPGAVLSAKACSARPTWGAGGRSGAGAPGPPRGGGALPPFGRRGGGGDAAGALLLLPPWTPPWTLPPWTPPPWTRRWTHPMLPATFHVADSLLGATDRCARVLRQRRKVRCTSRGVRRRPRPHYRATLSGQRAHATLDGLLRGAACGGNGGGAVAPLVARLVDTDLRRCTRPAGLRVDELPTTRSRGMTTANTAAWCLAS